MQFLVLDYEVQENGMGWAVQISNLDIIKNKSVMELQLSKDLFFVCFQVFVDGSETAVKLESLQPDTQYRVTLTPVYRDGDSSISVSALGSTCESHDAHMHTKQKQKLFTVLNDGSSRDVTQAEAIQPHWIEQNANLHHFNVMQIYV